MKTKLKPWFKWGCLTLVAIFAVLFLSIYILHRIQDSPSSVLRHALHLQNLPSSIRGLRMGSDVWTDEVRSFYFEIAPDQFPLLLEGRKFRINIDTVFEAKTKHMKPAVTFNARWEYMWETNGADCRIDVNDTKDRVTVLFTADLCKTDVRTKRENIS